MTLSLLLFALVVGCTGQILPTGENATATSNPTLTGSPFPSIPTLTGSIPFTLTPSLSKFISGSATASPSIFSATPISSSTPTKSQLPSGSTGNNQNIDCSKFISSQSAFPSPLASMSGRASFSPTTTNITLAIKLVPFSATPTLSSSSSGSVRATSTPASVGECAQAFLECAIKLGLDTSSFAKFCGTPTALASPSSTVSSSTSLSQSSTSTYSGSSAVSLPQTVTATSTPTSSITPSGTPTPSITPSVTPTAPITPSISGTPSVTPSNTPTISVSSSNTPSISTTSTRGGLSVSPLRASNSLSSTPSFTRTPSTTSTNTTGVIIAAAASGVLVPVNAILMGVLIPVALLLLALLLFCCVCRTGKRDLRGLFSSYSSSSLGRSRGGGEGDFEMVRNNPLQAHHLKAKGAQPEGGEGDESEEKSKKKPKKKKGKKKRKTKAGEGEVEEEEEEEEGSEESSEDGSGKEEEDGDKKEDTAPKEKDESVIDVPLDDKSKGGGGEDSSLQSQTSFVKRMWSMLETKNSKPVAPVLGSKLMDEQVRYIGLQRVVKSKRGDELAKEKLSGFVAPPGWKEKISSSTGEKYFVNTETKEKLWPKDLQDRVEELNRKSWLRDRGEMGGKSVDELLEEGGGGGGAGGVEESHDTVEGGDAALQAPGTVEGSTEKEEGGEKGGVEATDTAVVETLPTTEKKKKKKRELSEAELLEGGDEAPPPEGEEESKGKSV